ncbi:MAG: chemotaxis protein CheW [Verrucomicrobia bacterium]|nr:chemotaxis protein CheW [Verrucomicrobiota bacterium]
MSQELQQQFVRDMLAESYEGLDRFDRAILVLEQGAADAETLNDIFRVVHSLKGTAGCLGFQRIEKLTHAGESLLDLLRTGRLTPSQPIASALLRLSDNLRRLLGSVESTGADRNDDEHQPLIDEFTALRSGGVPVSSPLPMPPPVPPAPPAVATAEPAPAPAPGATPTTWGIFDESAPAPVPAAPGEPAASWGLFESATTPPPPAASPATPAPAATAAPAAPAASSVAASTVRVDVSLLDKLMNLVGELVLTRNQLTQVSQSRHLRAETVSSVSQRLNLVTTELQEGIMKTRMQPIGTIWSKFPRIVRDIAHDLGKQVRLETVGADTELDRTIIESIRDPLTHIIRNSIDHGIESPAGRAAAGKPAEGLILMRAHHEGGQVNIEIVDDGGGINLARVRQKAAEKGLLAPDAAARLTDREVLNLIFHPGFSTAEKVTNVSGRGVGMDVVKTNIEKIGGSVDVQSSAGAGTTLKIKIPLTLAIVPALIVRAGGERFAIPQVSLLELVRLEGEAAQKALEKVYDAPVFRLRGNLLPLVFLDRELKLPSGTDGDGILNIVVLQADQRSFGLVVDEVCDTEEIVVKPLGKQLKGLPMYAGATIMGDGRVALILDALGLAQHSRVVSQTQDRGHAAGTLDAAAASAAASSSQLLLFRVPGRDHLALPLDQAARLAEIETSTVERTGAREAVQYRGRIMPLVHVGRLLGGAAADTPSATGPLQVIVYSHSDHVVGLVVDEICDIVSAAVELQPGTAAPGIKGSAIIQGKITDFVDVGGILRTAGFPAARAA